MSCLAFYGQKGLFIACLLLIIFQNVYKINHLHFFSKQSYPHNSPYIIIFFLPTFIHIKTSSCIFPSLVNILSNYKNAFTCSTFLPLIILYSFPYQAPSTGLQYIDFQFLIPHSIIQCFQCLLQSVWVLSQQSSSVHIQKYACIHLPTHF